MKTAIWFILWSAATLAAVAQTAPDLITRYEVDPNVTYNVASNYPLKLDVIYPYSVTAPVPAVVYIHGGGWIAGSKTGAMLEVLPYLQLGWAAICVEYRLGEVARAPAAVEGCRCALRWIAGQARQYHIDPDRLVVTGHPAGGHLALIASMLTEADGLDNICPEVGPVPRVAAIVNRFGPTDVVDLLSGQNQRPYAVAWFGRERDHDATARLVSPINHVRAGFPPIITTHADGDPTVPYSHAVRVHEALKKQAVANQLVTLHNNNHSQFSQVENRQADQVVTRFLEAHGLSAANEI